MLTGGISAAKNWFFDRQAVQARVDRGRLRAMSRFGAFVRTKARSSIRSRKKVSEPGSPPSSHEGLLKVFLFFAYDPAADAVVVGPARINGRPRGGIPVPGLLERGGDVPAGGRVRVIAHPAGRGADGRFRKAHLERVVARGVFHYRPRPYMAPALAAEAPKFAELFRGEVR